MREHKKLICECCNEKEAAGVYASKCGPISHAYCISCLRDDIEPYNSLVGMVFSVDGYDNLYDSIQKMVDHNLKFYNKTREEFDREVNEMIKNCEKDMKDEEKKLSK